MNNIAKGWQTARKCGKSLMHGLIMGLLLNTAPAWAGVEWPAVVELYGTYQCIRQDPSTGRPHLADPATVDAAFHILLSGNAWTITVTNLNDISDPVIDWHLSKYSVGQVWCDGTNVFTQQPAHNVRGSYQTNLATVTPSCFYTASYDADFLGVSLPWLTYCLSPATVRPNKDGVVDLPIPWLQARFSPLAYAFRWDITASKDDRFVKDLSVVRDSILDLRNKDSLLRPSFVFPDSIASYERNIKTLGHIKGIPTGWVESTFSCTAWYKTNGISIPAQSKFEEYSYNPNITDPYPVYRASLTLSKVIIDEGAEARTISPDVSKPTEVFDFRYRRTNATRIYRFSTYSLQPGESWKSDQDKVLLAQSLDYLDHGPRYDHFLRNKLIKRVLVWLAIGVVTLIPLLAMLRNGKANKNWKNKSNKSYENSKC